ncbi:MAG: DUF2237 family protein [Thiobacillus sp.]
MSDARNVLGTLLQVCGVSPMTGFVRDGLCHTGQEDIGSHTICVQMTDAFLQYSLNRGNDLVSPAPEYDFPGLREGDRWCMCATRWLAAAEDGVAPPVILEATHIRALQVTTMADLEYHGLRAKELPGA